MATFVALLKHQNLESAALRQLKFVILIGGVPPPLENLPVYLSFLDLSSSPISFLVLIPIPIATG
jgi:hypothetical protein